MPMPGIYSRLCMVFEWINHLTDSGLHCAKGQIEKEHKGEYINDVNRKVDKAEG